jgi:hypothetical protein
VHLSVIYKHDSLYLSNLGMHSFLAIISVHLKTSGGGWGLNINSDKLENNLGRMLLNSMKLVVI